MAKGQKMIWFRIFLIVNNEMTKTNKAKVKSCVSFLCVTKLHHCPKTKTNECVALGNICKHEHTAQFIFWQSHMHMLLQSLNRAPNMYLSKDKNNKMRFCSQLSSIYCSPQLFPLHLCHHLVFQKLHNLFLLLLVTAIILA